MHNAVETGRFYTEYFKNSLMSFWDRAADLENGGVFTCFTNDGSKLISRDKYIWSQGRMAWIYSRLADDIRKGVLTNYTEEDAKKYLELGKRTCEFIRDHAILEPKDGVCAYLTAADGTKKESIPGKGYYTSYFVDCFVIIGFAGYARVAEDSEWLDLALEVYRRMMSYLDRGIMVAEPYPVHEGFRTHAKDMILSCVTSELWNAAHVLHHPQEEALKRKSLFHVSQILDTFFSPEYGVIQEMPAVKPEYEDTFLARHIMPCHALESMWFCLDILQQSGKKPDERIFTVARNSLRLGWDEKYGGMFRCVDIQGGPPKGRTLQDGYEMLMRDTWDSKLWWTNAEALYCTLRCYALTGDRFFAEYHDRVAKFDFTKFPNPDKKIGEWIQILDRQGRPMNKLVALPVKDPFHIMRDFLRIAELLHDCPNLAWD